LRPPLTPKGAKSSSPCGPLEEKGRRSWRTPPDQGPGSCPPGPGMRVARRRQTVSGTEGSHAQTTRPPLADPAPPLLFLPLVPYSARGHECALLSEGLHRGGQERDPPDGPPSEELRQKEIRVGEMLHVRAIVFLP